MIRQATKADIPIIKHMARRHKDELGFILRPALEESMRRGELIVAEDNGQIVGFCRFRKRQDGVTKIYEILSVKRGYGKRMLEVLERPIQAKCPVDLLANGWYQAMGFQLIGTEAGKKRELNLWELI